MERALRRWGNYRRIFGDLGKKLLDGLGSGDDFDRAFAKVNVSASRTNRVYILRSTKGF